MPQQRLPFLAGSLVIAVDITCTYLIETFERQYCSVFWLSQQTKGHDRIVLFLTTGIQ